MVFVGCLKIKIRSGDSLPGWGISFWLQVSGSRSIKLPSSSWTLGLAWRVEAGQDHLRVVTQNDKFVSKKSTTAPENRYRAGTGCNTALVNGTAGGDTANLS